MANQGLSAPLYQLFASLGLDATPLIEGLADADVDIKKFQNLMNDFSVGVGRAFKVGSSEVLAFQVAINQATKVMGSQADAAEYLNAQINNLVASEEKLIEAKKLEAESYLETIRVGQQQADIYRQEEQSRLEYSKLIQQLSQEEVAAYEAARAAKFESDTAELEMQQRLAAEKAASASKDEEYSRMRAYYAQQEVESEMAAYHELLDEYEEINAEMTRADLERLAARAGANGGGGGGGGSGYGGAGVRVGAGGLYPYLRLGQSLSGVAETLQPLMDVIFPIALIGLSIDLVMDYGKKIVDATKEVWGLGKANKEAWAEAFEGAAKSRQETLKYIEALNSVQAAGLTKKTGKAGALANVDKLDEAAITKMITSTRQELSVLQSRRATELSPVDPNDYGGIMDKLSRLYGVKETKEETDKKIKEDLQVLKELSDELFKRQIDQKKKEKEALETNVGLAKKWHDVVHEYSERLPSARTINPAAYMLQTLGFGPQPVQAVRASDVIGHPPISDVIPHRSYPSSGESYAPAAARATGGGSSVGGITLSFNINYKFDGIPADVQDFMRNKAEPRLMDDLKLNARGITDKLIQELKTRGVRVG